MELAMACIVVNRDESIHLVEYIFREQLGRYAIFE